MLEESEEACLVNNPRSPSISGYPVGLMPYTDGIQSFSQYGAQMNSTSSTVSPQSRASSNITGVPNNNSYQESTSGATVRSNDHCTIGGVSTESLGRGLQSHELESGKFVDFNDDILLSQFHADAIKQTGCRKFQLLAAIIIGLGLAGHAIQIYSVFYILPSAELEYCIVDNEKSWLQLITLLGLGCGALLWGGLAGRTGRRKTLLSCLAVSGVFSVVAAFMPTYGPFMMARFCAAAGFGGVLPSGASYLCEISPTYARSRILTLLGTIGISGAIFAGGIAILVIPHTGQMITVENKEHFSAWHRYLLIVSLPTFGSILGLFWLPESPRWLLDSGREVEALAIYQKIYRSNRAHGGYTLTELELPGARARRYNVPSSVLAGMAHSVHMFFNSFFELFRKSHIKTTLLLLICWTAAIFVFHGLTIFTAAHSRNVEQQMYIQQTLVRTNRTYDNVTFNTSMDNLIFRQCKFINCTFRRIFISHVSFENCSFIETEFAIVKTSRTVFVSSVLDNVKLIDTDLTERHFLHSMKKNINLIRLSTSCDQDFEFNIFLNALWKSNMGALILSVIAVVCTGELIHRFGRSRIATTCFTFATMLSCAFGFLFVDEHIIWIGGSAQGLILAGLAALTVLTIETYGTAFRCSAFGLFICGGHMGALLSVPIYSALPTTSSNFAAALSTVSMVIPVLSSAALKDPSLLL